MLFLTSNRVYWNNPRQDKSDCYQGKLTKRKLLSSLVGLIAWVRQLSRCTTVETSRWHEESTHLGISISTLKAWKERVEEQNQGSTEWAEY